MIFYDTILGHHIYNKFTWKLAPTTVCRTLFYLTWLEPRRPSPSPIAFNLWAVWGLRLF